MTRTKRTTFRLPSGRIAEADPLENQLRELRYLLAHYQEQILENEKTIGKSTDKTSEREACPAYVAELERAYLQILNSTTWRLMEPVRYAVRLVRGEKRPKPFRPRVYVGTDDA